MTPAGGPLIEPKAELSYGWARMKEHLPPFVLLVLAGWAISGLQASIAKWHGAAVLLRWLLAPFLLAASMQLSIVWIRTALRVHDGKPVDLGELSRVDLPGFFSYLLGALLYGIVVACGMVLLIVPGVLWAIRYGFFGFLIVDQGLDPLSAMRRSAELTRPVRGPLFVFGLLLLGVNLLGALALGIGLLFTVPASVMAVCRVYRRLLGAAGA